VSAGTMNTTSGGTGSGCAMADAPHARPIATQVVRRTMCKPYRNAEANGAAVRWMEYRNVATIRPDA